MTSCFCGCDEPVRGLAARGQNKQGRRTSEQLSSLASLIERCRALAEEHEVLERSIPSPSFEGTTPRAPFALNALAESLTELAEIGGGYADTWHSIIHDGYLPVEGVMNYKRAWLAWGKAAMVATPVLKSSDEDLIKFAIGATS